MLPGDKHHAPLRHLESVRRNLGFQIIFDFYFVAQLLAWAS